MQAGDCVIREMAKEYRAYGCGYRTKGGLKVVDNSENSIILASFNGAITPIQSGWLERYAGSVKVSPPEFRVNMPTNATYQ